MPRSIFATLLAIVLGLFFSGTAQAQVVAFGASNVSGYGVNAAEAFPAQLEGLLRQQGFNVSVRNAGVYGNTTTQMLNRLDQDVPPDTKIVILDMVGGYFNNAFQGLGRQQGDDDMRMIGAKLKARGIKIIPENSRDLPPSDRQADRVHLNPEGHRIVAARLLPLVMRALGRG